MKIENKLVNHIVKTNEIVNKWPQWKKNALGTSIEGKNFSALSFPITDSKSRKK